MVSMSRALFLAVLLFGTNAAAQPVIITALGASNTAGKGVSTSAAFPAQLENMLRARGIDAQVINAGVSGDTPDGMLARMNSAVPAGTRIVILNPGGNDLRACQRRRNAGPCATRQEHAASIARIRSALQSRGIRVIMAKFGGASDDDRQADGRHLTPEAHRRVAARLLPQVVAALGRSAGGQRAATGPFEQRPASAPEDSTRRSGSACREERQRFCGTSTGRCLLGRHMDQLSPACRAQVEANMRGRGR